jgi:hypothetical protein
VRCCLIGLIDTDVLESTARFWAQFCADQEDRVESKHFDSLTRTIGEQTNRRGALKVAAAGTLSVLGLGAVGRVALGQDVTAESRGYKGDSCTDTGKRKCRKGLFCDPNTTTCQYSRNCGGTKGAACQGNGQCCQRRNLFCNENNKCVRNK